ncbi:hypothetical protein [Amycolatopsis sp. H20-H5]|uniref:hypothetical protein n=1 Tax=Amycolatopsis sp. H20-H5 TaxID=3046309 RepID=UPI002DBC2D1D|nr:hypothetical protein [Amycolatopsis sp. H20-H5]MEC3973980.1 hypothetical protein [Amycolatopsis sp. H20-H5]
MSDTTGAGDFDFFVGDWDITNRRLLKPLTGSDEWDTFPATSRSHGLFEGAGNFDEFSCPARGFRGMTLRLYAPETGEWSLYWANNRTGRLQSPVTGRYADNGEGEGEGDFYGDDEHDGTPIRVRYRWTRVSSGSPRWEQAYSTDGEATWETNWFMDFTRR